MPRVRPSDHYHRYQFLRMAWLEFPKLYSALSLHGQRQLHEFYCPADELTKTELLEHITTLTKDKPALVHQAGKHYKRLQQVFRYVSEQLGIPRYEWYKALDAPIEHFNPATVHVETKDGHSYTVRGIARPQVDVEKLSEALLGLVKQQEEGGKGMEDKPIREDRCACRYPGGELLL